MYLKIYRKSLSFIAVLQYDDIEIYNHLNGRASSPRYSRWYDVFYFRLFVGWFFLCWIFGWMRYLLFDLKDQGRFWNISVCGPDDIDSFWNRTILLYCSYYNRCRHHCGRYFCSQYWVHHLRVVDRRFHSIWMYEMNEGFLYLSNVLSILLVIIFICYISTFPRVVFWVMEWRHGQLWWWL